MSNLSNFPGPTKEEISASAPIVGFSLVSMTNNCYTKCMDSNQTTISSSEKKCMKNCIEQMIQTSFTMFETLEKEAEDRQK